MRRARHGENASGRGRERTSAQVLAAAIRRQFGAAALGGITGSGTNWTVNMTIADGVTVP